jgi:hypothetical protein
LVIAADDAMYRMKSNHRLGRTVPTSSTPAGPVSPTGPF